MLINENIPISGVPRLSVIIASYNSEKTIGRCLLSLRNQRADTVFEIIVVDSSSDGTAKVVEEKFPQVRLYRFPERKFPGDARNFGISIAKAETIAFIDADCAADENWAAEILKAHRRPYLAVSGSVANGNLSNYVGWAAYFCEFSQWMPAKRAKWLTDAPFTSMSYKRKVFELYGRFREGTYCADTAFHWRLGRNGYRIRFEPSIIVFHHGINNFGTFLKHEFFHGMSFARIRVKEQNFSNVRRFIYIIFSFLIPLKIFLKITRENVKRRAYSAYFFRSIPALFPGIIFWSLGECVGYFDVLKGGYDKNRKDNCIYGERQHSRGSAAKAGDEKITAGYHNNQTE